MGIGVDLSKIRLLYKMKAEGTLWITSPLQNSTYRKRIMTQPVMSRVIFRVDIFARELISLQSHQGRPTTFTARKAAEFLFD